MEVLEGSRFGSIVYLHNGFLYIRNKTRNKVTYFRCRENHCSVLASVHFNSESVRVNGDHEHPAPVEDVEELRLRAELRRAVQRDSRSVRTIFDEVAARFPKSKLEFSTVCTQLWRARQLGHQTVGWTETGEGMLEDFEECPLEVDIQEGSGSLNIEGDPCPSTSNMQFAAPEVEEPEYHPSEAPGVSHMSYIPPGAPGVSHMSYPSDPPPFLPTLTPVAEETSTQRLDTGSGIVKEKPTSTILADVIPTTTTNSTSGSTSGVKIKPIDALQSKNTSGKAREPKPKENVQTSTVDINAKTLESAIQRLETVSNKLTAVSLVDSYDQFGKYISTVLRGLPIKKVKSLKQKIMSQVLEAMAPEESGPPKDVPVNLTSELRSNFRKHVAEQSQAANLPQDPTSLGSKIPIRGNMPILFPGIFTPNQPYMVPPGVVVGRASSVTTDAMSSNTLPPPDEAAVKNADGSFMETTVPKPMIPYGSNQSSSQPARGRKRRKNTAACQAKKIPSQCETTVHNVTTSGDDSSADEPPTSRTDERTNEERDFEMDIEEGKELKRIKEDEDMFETVICGESPSLYIKEEAPDPEEGDGPPRPPSVNPLSTQERPTCHLCNAQYSSKDQLDTHLTTAHPGQAPATGGYYGT